MRRPGLRLLHTVHTHGRHALRRLCTYMARDGDAPPGYYSNCPRLHLAVPIPYQLSYVIRILNGTPTGSLSTLPAMSSEITTRKLPCREILTMQRSATWQVCGRFANCLPGRPRLCDSGLTRDALFTKFHSESSLYADVRGLIAHATGERRRTKLTGDVSLGCCWSSAKFD